MRKMFVAGNWKMNLNGAEALALVTGLAGKASAFGAVEVGVIPPFVYIGQVRWAIKSAGGDASLGIGAQDVYFEKNGAFTGEISTSMLADLGVKYVLVGHSERRHVIGETDALLNKKLHAILNAGLVGILCVGEKLEERQGNKTFDVCKTQLVEGLKGVDKAKASQIVIAYEPVWAIGTGLNASKEQAQEVHAFIRAELATIFDAGTAAGIRIQYGGSVKASNAAELLSQPDVDGALVGGASLKVDDFVGIIAAAAAVKK